MSVLSSTVMPWEADPPHLQPSKGYLRVRRVNRAIMETWFREISTVDVDTLPEEGGIIYTAWHPGGLIDPMLMMAALPGGLTFAAKSRLFKIPVLSRIMKWIDVQPVEREQDGVASPEERKKANSKLIDTLAELVANGERIAIFPEGLSHTESYAVELKTGAARILLEAHRRAVEAGKPTPNIVPIGLHYSDQHSFRERVSLQINRPLEAPPLPQAEGAPKPSEEELNQHGEQAHDRAWCNEVTSLLQTEINRTSHAQESWEDRELVWRARRMIHTIRSVKTFPKSVTMKQSSVLDVFVQRGNISQSTTLNVQKKLRRNSRNITQRWSAFNCAHGSCKIEERRSQRKPLSRIWHYGSGLHHGCLVLLLGQP